jgi:hypothetical protein
MAFESAGAAYGKVVGENKESFITSAKNAGLLGS